MRRKGLVLLFFIISIMLVLASNVYAIDTSIIKETEYTEEYKEWLELSVEDKAKTIAPRKYEVRNSRVVNLFGGGRITRSALATDYDLRTYIDRLKQIQLKLPEVAFTTDVIVGFPNETEEDFKEMIENIKKINFSKLHVFPYSLREGTKAALMENQIDDNTKKERAHRLLELSKELEIKYMEKFINKKIEVLFETYKDGYLYGHTSNYLSVKIKGNKELTNELVLVNIEKIEYPNCFAKICEKNFAKQI